MSRYRIELLASAKRALAALDAPTRRRVAARIDYRPEARPRISAFEGDEVWVAGGVGRTTGREVHAIRMDEAPPPLVERVVKDSPHA